MRDIAKCPCGQLHKFKKGKVGCGGSQPTLCAALALQQALELYDFHQDKIAECVDEARPKPGRLARSLQSRREVARPEDVYRDVAEPQIPRIWWTVIASTVAGPPSANSFNPLLPGAG